MFYSFIIPLAPPGIKRKIFMFSLRRGEIRMRILCLSFFDASSLSPLRRREKCRAFRTFFLTFPFRLDKMNCAPQSTAVEFLCVLHRSFFI
jgi:hypothetical protein